MIVAMISQTITFLHYDLIFSIYLHSCSLGSHELGTWFSKCPTGVPEIQLNSEATQLWETRAYIFHNLCMH